MIPTPSTADHADTADKGPRGRGSVSASSAPSVVKTSGWLGFFRSLFATYGGEVEVRIGENSRGGFSIFPVNDNARRLFSADPDGACEAGNFGTYADAYKRAARDNCWTVVESAEEAAA